MTRIYLHNHDIKDLSREYDEIKRKIDTKELKRHRKRRKNRHSKRRKDES